VEVAGQLVAVSNLDKVLYPSQGFTKAAVIDYYVQVADAILPHLAGRPLTMLRFPDGVEGGSFYEKRCPDHRPDFVRTVRLGREGRDKVVDHCDVRDLPTLVWAANLAALELHTSLARAPDTSVPTMVVFDLDPGEPAGTAECARVALWLQEIGDRLGLVLCPKTSGSKGLQVYVPVNGPTSYDETKSFALAVGQLLERVHPELVLTSMSKQRRGGKVFVDWSQNTLTKTTVCAYSLRAREVPTVSTPLRWDEVSDGADGRHHLRFHARHVVDRVRRHGDLFAPTLEVTQELPELA
jgi:bifunctional non-homologous end joining protein LigD